jgi:hypothetical protein
LVYSEVASLGSFLAKDKNIKVVFIQNSLLVSFIFVLNRLVKTLLKYQTIHSRVKSFLKSPLFLTLSP